jgi:geranylgeranyl pyrophosphate synthase
LGLGFQIADDLLDLTATEEKAGKGVAKDASAGKQTYPRCVGIEQSRAAARQAAERAIAALSRFGQGGDDLRELAGYVVDRSF